MNDDGVVIKSTSDLSVIIPAYNAELTLGACLEAIVRSTRRPDDIIVFDDGSTDRTVEIAKAHGARIVSNGKRAQGPAIGRNLGADAAHTTILVFIDADVIVDPEAIARLEAPIAKGSAVASFGSYNSRPRCQNVAAYYYNLRHHWVHQQGQTEAFTFWSGLGAVKRDVFLDRGGFDPAFLKPSVEDVDLGLRIIKAGGKIQLIKDAQASHWKNWTLKQLWHTDIFRRAVPWARMMKEGRGLADDLNIATRERISAVVAHLVLLSALASIIAPALLPFWLASVATYLGFNAAFFAFLFRTVSVATAIGGIALHWCYHVYASVTFVIVKYLPARAIRKDAAVSPA